MMPTLVREQVEIPESFLHQYVFHMWVAFRAESEKVLGGRDSFIDYTLKVVRDAEIKYRFTKGNADYTANLLSAKTLQNFLQMGEVTSSFGEKRSAFKKKASVSQKTLSYIFIFLYAKKPTVVASWRNLPEDMDLDSSGFYDSIDQAARMRITFSPFSQAHFRPLLLVSTSGAAHQSSIGLDRLARSKKCLFSNSNDLLVSAYVVVFFQSENHPLDTVLCCPLDVISQIYRKQEGIETANKFAEPLDNFFYYSLGFIEPTITVNQSRIAIKMGQYQGVAGRYETQYHAKRAYIAERSPWYGRRRGHHVSLWEEFTAHLS